MLDGLSTMFELVFFTSSRIKNQHAKYLSRYYDIRIVNFKEIRANANYDEPHINDRKELLKISFENAKKQAEISKLGKNKAFIIEDTSVNIYPLSSKYQEEYPGVNIKFWMRDTLFPDIDLELEMTGDGQDRSSKVRSDLVLYLPQESEEPIYFYGETEGSITKLEYEFETNPIYPWLDNKTFSKWFIPKNEKSVLSQLPIEKADVHDFRKKPFDEMLDYLHKKGLIKLKTEQSKDPFQKTLENHHFHFVTGLTCSGKTTIANYLIEEFDFLHVEASDFMHQLYRENHGINGSIRIGTFAKELLNVKPTAVAERVVEYLNSFEQQDVVITGFRITDEIDFVKSTLTLPSKLTVLEAEQSTRELRKAIRSRDLNNIESLKERDVRELQMGTKELFENPQAILIDNNSDFEKLYDSYTDKLGLVKSVYPLKKHSDINTLHLKDLIILALYVAREQKQEKSEYYSTTDICNLVNSLGISKPKFVNNVGRFFSQQNNALFEIIIDTRGRKYRLSNTGAGYAKTILRSFSF